LSGIRRGASGAKSGTAGSATCGISRLVKDLFASLGFSSME